MFKTENSSSKITFISFWASRGFCAPPPNTPQKKPCWKWYLQNIPGDVTEVIGFRINSFVWDGSTGLKKRYCRVTFSTDLKSTLCRIIKSLPWTFFSVLQAQKWAATLLKNWIGITPAAQKQRGSNVAMAMQIGNMAWVFLEQNIYW